MHMIFSLTVGGTLALAGAIMLGFALFHLLPQGARYYLHAKVAVNYFVIVRRLYTLYDDLDAKRMAKHQRSMDAFDA